MKKVHGIRKIILGLILALLVLTPLFVFIRGYFINQPQLVYTLNNSTSKEIVTYPNSEFAVISDLHYYDTSLGTTGSAFQKALSSDRKLLIESADLINLAVDNILKSGVKFVLVSGDLTKDGELVCHQKLATALDRLNKSGINVYVVPGNHDVNNPGAFKYEGDKEIPVPNVTAEQFAEIYTKFGYEKAIYKDKNSLSYVAEPVKNLWVVAVDSCRSEENKPGTQEIVGGKLTQDQEKWLESVLKKADESGKAVILLEHHGIVEHWKGQSKLHKDYLIEDYKDIGKLLASYNVRLAFTGHYHAQDITKGSFDDGKYLYDVETGSLITSPCTIRYCSINNNKINITSNYLISKFKPGTDFETKANLFVHDTIKSEAYKTLRKYYVSETDADYIAEYVSAAFIAHYNGDEDIKKKPEFDLNKLSLWSRVIFSQQKYIINGLWKDLEPADNNISFDLGK